MADNCLCCGAATNKDRRLLTSESSKSVVPTLVELFERSMKAKGVEFPGYATSASIMEWTTCRYACKSCYKKLGQFMRLQQELEAHILNVLDSGLVPSTAATVVNPGIKRARCMDQTMQTPKKRKDPDLSVRSYAFLLKITLLHYMWYMLAIIINNINHRLSLIMKHHV